MTIRVHYYQPRDGIDVCKNCGAVRNRDAVGPRWCPGKPPAIETRSECVVPPPGWRCTRAAGHDGPCAAERESEAAKITRAEIEELRRLHEKAELGSLKVNRHDHDSGDINWQVQQEDDPGEVIANALESDFDNPRAVAELLAGAVNALPSLLDAADERDRLEASRVGIMAKLGELHEHLALMVRYLEEETSQGDGIAEQHWDGYQGAKSALVRTAPDQPQWEEAQIEICELLAKASEVPGLSATLDEVRGERDRLRALLAECADVLPSLEHFGRYTSSERDARELRERIEAELGCGQAVVAHETPEGE